MAFSTVAAYMIFFFGIMMFIASVMMIYAGMVDSSNIAYEVQKERMEVIVGTRISIAGTEVEKGTSPDTLILNLTSSGTSKLRPEFVDVYVDGVRVPRGSRSYGFPDGSGGRNRLLWDPYELLQVNVSLDIAPGEHVAEVTTEHGVSASRSFTA